jgi:4-methyl-5(b-hydroxyethyl)-thiazole monophosphate biosynthesis
MRKRVLVPIADGTEELEAVAIIDTLRRAGAEVIVASVDQLQITASRGVKLVADRLIAECAAESFDLIALPGGMPGAEHLRDCKELTDMLKKQNSEGKLYAAICAAPVVVLQPHGLLAQKNATCHPARHNDLENNAAAAERVVVDGNLITSQGPGTAVEFALKLIEMLFNKQKADTVAGPMVVG